MITQTQSQRTLQVPLYSGIILIITSMLFLNQDYRSASFPVQAMMVLAAPVFFYFVGAMVYRFLDAPLAAPGIVSTGAWLVGVSLIHLYDQRLLLPDGMQSYYWCFASTLAALVITLTGHKIRSWLVIPLMLFMQVNLVWSLMSIVGIGLQWWPPLSFILVIAWWEIPVRQPALPTAYRSGATLLTFALILISYGLNTSTTESIVATWTIGAVVIMVLGSLHGFLNFIPMATVMLVCASLWGLNPVWWPFAWLAMATVTILFVEHQQRREHEHLAVDLSVGLSVILCGAAVLFSMLSPLVHVHLQPLAIALSLLEAGFLLVWLGWRREIVLAAHLGLWLIAAAWSQFYFVWFIGTQTFGLWLALLAVMALLVERLISSMAHRKHKHLSMREALMRWPIADLSLGLTILMLIWTLTFIRTANPIMITVTTMVTVGIWLVAGLIYRLPVLIHAASWVAPLPFALLLMFIFDIEYLPLIGLAWQLLAIGYLILGHSLYQQRPAVRQPFFIAGYGILHLSIILTLRDHYLAPVSIGLAALTNVVTAALVLLERHETWSIFVARFISPDERPYAFKNVHNLFLMLGAWLAAIWIHITLPHTDLTFPQQGIVLVLFSAAFIVSGRLIPRVPDAVGWPVYGAGWFVWLMGLVYVFPFPTEALITVILGLLITSEAVFVSRHSSWMPVFVLQVVFTGLQLTRLLNLPPDHLLLIITAAITSAGLYFPHDNKGRLAARSGGFLTVGLWLLHHDLFATIIVSAPLVVALVRHRRWEWLLALAALWNVFMLTVNVSWGHYWPHVIRVGQIQLVIGTLTLLVIRPRRCRTVFSAYLNEYDWATPFLWFGAAMATWGMIGFAIWGPLDEATLYSLTAVTIFCATVSNLRYAHYIPLLLVAIITMHAYNEISFTSYKIQSVLFMLSLAAFALMTRLALTIILLNRRPFGWLRGLVLWIRPALVAQYIAVTLSVYIGFVWNSRWGSNDTQQFLLSIYGMMLIGWSLLTFYQHRNTGWIWLALIFGGWTWLHILTSLNLYQIVFYTIPLTAVLFGVTYLVRDPAYKTRIEMLAFAGLFAGILFDVIAYDLSEIAAGLQFAAVAVYGYVAGRRIPFISGAGAVAAGISLKIMMASFWFFPLLLGLGLMGVALGLEVRRDFFNHYYGYWRSRWQEWQ